MDWGKKMRSFLILGTLRTEMELGSEESLSEFKLQAEDDALFPDKRLVAL